MINFKKSIAILPAVLLAVMLTVSAAASSDWDVRITASGDGSPSTVTVGMAGTPSSEIYPPSPPPESVTHWWLENGGNDYTIFIVQHQNSYEWKARLNVTAENEVFFSWENLEAQGVPDNKMLVMHIPGFDNVNLRERDNYGPVTMPAGYYYNYGHVTITAETVQPPTADFSYSPESPTTQDAVQFTDNSTDPDGSVESWFWEFGDGENSTARNPTHSYDDDGTYTVTLTATDDDGATDSYSEDISVSNVAPTADFSYAPASPQPDEDVSFDASASSDPDGTVASYEWDFGDGATGTGQTATHSYASEGTYTVTLTATDDDGATDSYSEDVTVSLAPQIVQEYWGADQELSIAEVVEAVKDYPEEVTRSDIETLVDWLYEELTG